MNAATRTAVRWCLAKGHIPLLIHNGFTGLLEDNVDIPNWLRVDGWTIRGGSELGTNRILPDVDLGGIAAKIQQHQIEGLLLVGGFEAFLSVKMMEEKREQYPAFRVSFKRELVSRSVLRNSSFPVNASFFLDYSSYTRCQLSLSQQPSQTTFLSTNSLSDPTPLSTL